MRKMWLRLFYTDFEESASRQPWHCKVIVIAFHFAKEDEVVEDVIAFLFCSKEHFEGGKDLQRFWGWFGGKWTLFAKILRKMWLCFFLQRFRGWFWGKFFAKILRKMLLDNLDSSILGARSNHPVVVRRKCKISHLTVSFWSQKKTKYILPPQILVHREVFNWSPLKF